MQLSASIGRGGLPCVSKSHGHRSQDASARRAGLHEPRLWGEVLNQNSRLTVRLNGPDDDAVHGKRYRERRFIRDDEIVSLPGRCRRTCSDEREEDGRKHAAASRRSVAHVR